MTSVLAEKTCTPCRGGVPPLTIEEAEAYRVRRLCFRARRR
jgi:4a-hydroxytetrahydrobiopterin dehydratase